MANDHTDACERREARGPSGLPEHQAIHGPHPPMCTGPLGAGVASCWERSQKGEELQNNTCAPSLAALHRIWERSQLPFREHHAGGGGCCQQSMVDGPARRVWRASCAPSSRRNNLRFVTRSGCLADWDTIVTPHQLLTPPAEPLPPRQLPAGSTRPHSRSRRAHLEPRRSELSVEVGGRLCPGSCRDSGSRCG
jgi:hypothetical protein